MKVISFLTLILIGTISFAAEPITIAAIYSQTGSQSPLDQAAWKGSQLAVKEMNAKGGILGHLVVLKLFDAGSNPQTLTKIATQIAADSKINFVIGLNDNSLVQSILPTLTAANKVFISPGATSPTLTKQYPHFYYQISFTDNVQAAAAAQYVIDQLHRLQAVVFYQADMSYASDLAHYFAAIYPKLGGKVTGMQTITEQLTPVQIELLQKQQLNVIYLAAAPEAVGKLVKQIREAKINTPIIGGDSYSLDVLNKLPSNVADSVYFTTETFFDPAFMEDNLAAFMRNYQKTYGTKPQSINTALGYDAITVLEQGIKKAKSIEPKKVDEALSTLPELTLLSGTVTLNRVPANDTVAIVKVVSGKAKIAAMVVPQNVPPVK